MLCGSRVEPDEGAPPVGGVLTAVDEAMVLELADELARGGQREAELARDLADRPLAFGGDVGEHTDVAATERRVAADEVEQLRRRPSARPAASDDPSQKPAELAQIVAMGNIGHLLTDIVR